MRPTDTAILGLGTALPAHRVEQPLAAEALGAALAEERGARQLLRRAFRTSGVQTRFSCVPDFDPAAPGPLLGRPPPGTGHRMRLYARHAPVLAAQAARRALRAADAGAAEVRHLILVTCTGFAAPGTDVALVRSLGLAADVSRTIIGFMGCHGAFNGLRVARQAVGATGGVALVVCVELCSLHLQVEGSRDSLVAAALFGDGAAAAIVGRESARRPPLVHLGAARSRLTPDAAEHMSWKIGDTGFEMRLSRSVPGVLETHVGEFVAPLLPSSRGPVRAWGVHPGGPAVLDCVGRGLGLAPAELDDSRAVLRNVGNVSSATVLFVLARACARLCEDAPGVLLGFGPGLTMEGLAFTRGAAAVPAPRAQHAEVRA